MIYAFKWVFFLSFEHLIWSCRFKTSFKKYFCQQNLVTFLTFASSNTTNEKLNKKKTFLTEAGNNSWWRGDKKVRMYIHMCRFWSNLKAFGGFVFIFHPFFCSFFIWLHKKASCEPSSLNEKHVAGIQNSGVFQRGPSRHLFQVCSAKVLEREGRELGVEEKRRSN